MAAPGGEYFIQKTHFSTTAEHHQSFEKLWTTKWKQPCSMGVYPFMFAAIQDFEPIVEKLIKDGLKEPYDWDEYASYFVPKAEELVSRAQSAEKAGNQAEASELYLRASAVYRISRFPAPRSHMQREAWTKGKAACLSGLRLHATPMDELLIPHTAGIAGEGSHIPTYAHIPPSGPSPCMILMTGLDGYRTELCVWAAGFAAQGIATIVLEIPGTGDSPALAGDITSSDRLFDSLAAWLQTPAAHAIDASRTAVWGFSTGGYHVTRAAHTHASRFAGFVSQGGGAHHMFDAEWLDAAQRLEYPFDLGSTLGHKFGYGDDFARFKAEAGRFSLVRDGTLDRPCGKLLLVNGDLDGIFPIDDLWVVLGHGGPKAARVVPGRAHMGEPEAFFVILKWLYEVLGVKGDVGAQMKTLPFKAKFP